jgi:hypothetical protein
MTLRANKCFLHSTSENNADGQYPRRLRAMLAHILMSLYDKKVHRPSTSSHRQAEVHFIFDSREALKSFFILCE